MLRLMWADCVGFSMGLVVVGDVVPVLGSFWGLGGLRIWICACRLRLNLSIVTSPALLIVMLCFLGLAGFRT